MDRVLSGRKIVQMKIETDATPTIPHNSVANRLSLCVFEINLEFELGLGFGGAGQRERDGEKQGGNIAKTCHRFDLRIVMHYKGRSRF
jgi:hypothetical protein